MSDRRPAIAPVPPGFEHEADGLAVRFAPLVQPRGGDLAVGRGTGTLIVVFSQARVPRGHFGLSRLFAHTQHHGLFLNDLDGRWYRGRAAAVDRAVDAAVAALRAVLGAPPRIVYYGSSMGGTGALATALRRGDGEAIAFAPDLAIGAAGSQSARAGIEPDPADPDLTEALRRWRGPAIDLVFGLFDPADAASAAAVAAMPEAPTRRLVAVASTHEVHDHLFSLNLVRRVIAGFARPIVAEVAARGLSPIAPDFAALARLGALAAAMAAGAAIDPAAVDALGLGGNPGAAQLAAEAEAARGDYGRAADRLAAMLDAIAADPVLSTLPKRAVKAPARRMIALLAAAGRKNEACAALARWRALHPNDERFVALGEVIERAAGAEASAAPDAVEDRDDSRN